MNIIVNASIYPMDKSCVPVSAMAWQNGRILRLGRESDLVNEFPSARLIDAHGRTIVPGFIDPHIHFLQGILYRRALDCSPDNAPTIDALKNRLSIACHGKPATSWIIGQGYDPTAFTDGKGPTRYDLDQACPDNPAVVFHYSFHECVANSKALDLAGIDENTKSPYAGKIQKDSDGRPTGLLIETAMAKVHLLSQNFLLQYGKEDILLEFSKAQADLFASGITRIGDPAVDTGMIDFYREADKQGQLHLPVVFHFCSNHQMLTLPWDVVSQPPPAFDSPNLICGPLKIFLDGADRAGVELSLGQYALTCIATLWRSLKQFSLKPIQVAGRSPSRLRRDFKVHIGTMMAKKQDGINLAEKATKMGFALCFHAIGNEAVKQAVEIIKKVRHRHPAEAPPRIEHALFVDDTLIRKIREQSIAIVTQPGFLSHMSKENVPFLPGLKQMPLKSYLNTGIRVAGSSDWPVASHDPLLAMHHAISRETVNGETLQINEAITLQEAMMLYTTQAAHVLGCSADAGTLEAGKRADFIVLNSNPFTDPSRLKKMKVSQTWIGGKRVF